MEFLYISIEPWSVRVGIFTSDHDGFILYKSAPALKHVVPRKGAALDW